MSFIKSLSKHPKELWILSLSELCERFAFWGIGNLLVLYLIESYHFPGEKATQVYGMFTGLSAFLPFFGGWVADRWNYQSPLFLGALFNAIGCFLIAAGIPLLLYPALFLLALGYGIFTPSLLTVMGFAYRNHASLREAGFSIYYASINIGVFLALFSLGSIARMWSWHVAFSIAGIVQLIGLLPIFIYIVQHKQLVLQLKEFHAKAHTQKKPLTKEERDRLWVIAIFCFVSLLFWINYNQAFSSMAIFVHSYTNRTIAGMTIPEGIFLSTESFFLLLLAPLLASLYAYFQKKRCDPSPSIKTALSLFFTTACFFVMVIASLKIPSNALTANVFWGYVVGAYFLLAVGEMLLAPIGLSMVSRLSPPRYTATLVGLWYLCIGVAFFTGGLLASLMNRLGGLFHFFLLFVAITFFPACLMLLLAKKLTKMSHTKPLKILPHVER